MANVGHLNLPKPGQPRPVDPIRSEEAIKKIKENLQGNYRDLLLFTIGINSGIRMFDLVTLKVKDFKDVGPGEVVHIRERKTNKTKRDLRTSLYIKVL